MRTLSSERKRTIVVKLNCVKSEWATETIKGQNETFILIK